MPLLRFVLAAMFTLALASPAAAQRCTAKQNGDIVEIADTAAQMVVPVVWSMSDAWRIQVKGKDLVRTTPTVAEFIEWQLVEYTKPTQFCLFDRSHMS